MIAALVVDLRARRIPNRLILVGLAGASILHAIALAAHQPGRAGPDAWSPLAGLLAGGAALLPLYWLRACGAGDVKLMAMVGAFIGAPLVLVAALYTLLAGGLLSLVFMLPRGVAAQTRANVRFMLTDWSLRLRTGQGARIEPLAMTAARLPYAVAIALGTAAALIWPLARTA
ncbi:MAG: prepilin peptidase [Burkholderiales bacterium]|nr:prepilin peptidase [Burkholderiales bacterium]